MKVVLYEKLLAATGKNIRMDVAVLKELPQAVCSQRRCSEIVDALNLPGLSGLSELKSYGLLQGALDLRKKISYFVHLNHGNYSF